METSELIDKLNKAQYFLKEIENKVPKELTPQVFGAIFTYLLIKSQADSKTSFSQDPNSYEDFVQIYNLKTLTERALGALYYSYHYESKKDGLSISEIENFYRQARSPLPTNISDILKKLGKRKPKLIKINDLKNKLWIITTDGDKLIRSREKKKIKL